MAMGGEGLNAKIAAAGVVLMLTTAARADDFSALYRATWAEFPRRDSADGARRARTDTATRPRSAPQPDVAGDAFSPVRGFPRKNSRRRYARAEPVQFALRLAPSQGPGIADDFRCPRGRDRGRTRRRRHQPQARAGRAIPSQRHRPLSVMTLIRAAIRRGATAFTIPVYDGARRSTRRSAFCRATPGPWPAPRLDAAGDRGFKGESSEDGDPTTRRDRFR